MSPPPASTTLSSIASLQVRRVGIQAGVTAANDCDVLLTINYYF